MLRGKTTIEAMKNHVECFLKLAEVVDLIQRTARNGIGPADLQRATSAYLQCFKLVYDETCMIVKFHYAHHFAGYVTKWKMLPSCFVHERKHKVTKRFGNQIVNTSSNWEGQVLREVTGMHIWKLTSDDSLFAESAALIQPHAPKNAVAKFLREAFSQWERHIGIEQLAVATRARINSWEKVSTNDVVLCKDDAVGQIRLLVSVDFVDHHVVLACIDVFQAHVNLPRCKKWRRIDAPTFVSADNLVCALIWTESEGLVTTLKPNVV